MQEIPNQNIVKLTLQLSTKFQSILVFIVFYPFFRQALLKQIQQKEVSTTISANLKGNKQTLEPATSNPPARRALDFAVKISPVKVAT